MKSNLGIYSGEYLIGICGETTTLTDYKNEALPLEERVINLFLPSLRMRNILLSFLNSK